MDIINLGNMFIDEEELNWGDIWWPFPIPPWPIPDGCGPNDGVENTYY